MNIKAVYNAIDTELSLVNKKLLSIASSKHSLVSDVVSHIIANGKRVRPALVILMAKAFGIKNLDSIVNSAFAIEMIHTASLLHDDVVDGTKKRRGKKTANILWGNKEVILVGDHLFTQAFLAISALQNNDAVNIIANASHNLTVGEIIQLQNEQNIRITFENYLEVIYNKTASLFEAATMLGAIFSNSANVDLCKEFGKNIGIAFQIMDDILDYTGSVMLNKDTGTDFREKKVTMPIIFLLSAVESLEKKQIEDHFSGTNDMDFQSIKKLLDKYSIINLCNNEMQKYINNTLSFVRDNITDIYMQNLFLEFLNFFTARVS